MKTVSVLMQTLCVPCHCRCRHCLLSWDGRPVGADYARSEALAARWARWMRANRLDLSFSFAFGYSMDHPELLRAVDFLASLGSPGAEFLPFDGMAFRPEAELSSLLRALRSHGVRRVNFTFYGMEACHDRFAGRSGDYRYMRRTMSLAAEAGLEVTAGVLLNTENAGQAELLLESLESAGAGRVSMLIPHGEGRGAALEGIRLRSSDLARLGPRSRALFPAGLYRPESEWVRRKPFLPTDSRMLLLSLTPENIGWMETASPAEVIAWAEALDEAYYGAIPPLEELAALYGDPDSDALYRQRDLFHRYQRRYIREHGLALYDVTDERQSGSRRF